MHENTTRLVFLLGTAVRVLATIQVISLIDYVIFRSLFSTSFQPVGDLFENLFIIVQLFSITFLVIVSSTAELAPVGLLFLLMIMAAALIQSILECVRVFGSNPFTWVEAFFTVYYLCLNIAITITAVLARFFFAWETWDEAVKLYSEIGSLFGSAYAKIESTRVAVLYFFSEILIPAEVVTLTFYFIAIGYSGPGNYNFTGWIYVLHLFGIICSIAWHEQTRAFNGRTENEKRLGLGPTPPSRQSLVNIYTLLFFFDAAQLVYVQENDHSQLVVLRSFLCVIAGIYLVVCILLGLRYDLPPRHIAMFYAIQFVVALFVTVEGFWLASYFCYAQATQASILYWNFSHVISFSTALALVFVANKPLNALAALGIVAFLVLCVDIIVLGRIISLDWSGADIFVQVVFLLISLGYVGVATVIWPGSFERDGDQYMRLMVREKLTADSVLDTLIGSYDTKGIDTEQKLQAWLERVARRIYYIVTGPIKTVAIIELVFVVYYTMILGVNCTRDPGPPGGDLGVCLGSNSPLWYQWFYLVHFVSAFAAFVVVTFELSIHTALMFLVIMSIVCLLVDSILMGVLWDKVSKGELSLQSFFFGCDVLQLLFFALAISKSDPRAYAKLLTMEKLSDRIAIKE